MTSASGLPVNHSAHTLEPSQILQDLLYKGFRLDYPFLETIILDSTYVKVRIHPAMNTKQNRC